MRRSPQSAGRAALLLAMILALSLWLLTTLTPLSSADNGTEMEDEFLAVALMQGGEDGRVTDDDGWIGNGESGADRPAEDDPLLRGAMPDHSPDAQRGDTVSPVENGREGDGNSLGILPWIIASLVVLAVVLVILALLPKKNRSH